MLLEGCDRLEVFCESNAKTAMGGETSDYTTEGRFLTGTLYQKSSEKNDAFRAQGRRDTFSFFTTTDPRVSRGHVLLVVDWGDLKASKDPGADNTGLFQTLEVTGIKYVPSPGCSRYWKVTADFRSLGDRLNGIIDGIGFGFAGIAYGTGGTRFGFKD